MPVKYREAHQADPEAGNNLDDESYIGAELDNGAGQRSTSIGAKLAQLVTYLRTHFYTATETAALFLGYVPKVTSPVSGNAVVLTSQGTLSNAGAPLMTLEVETVTVANWGRMSHSLENHSLSKAPDLVQIAAVFKIAHDSYSQGDEIVLGLGAAGGFTNESAIAVAVTATQFQILNSAGSTSLIMVPKKSAGNEDSLVLTETEVSLKVTLVAFQATA